MKAFYLTIVLLIICGCDKYDIRLNIKNSNNETIYTAISMDDQLENSEEITSGSDKKSHLTRKIETGKTENIERYGFNAWNDFLKFSNEKSMRVFVIPESVFNTNSWEDICKKRMYTKVLKYSLNDLEKANWLIDIKS